MLPETRYAKSGEVHIAYQVIGSGPFDLVFVPGFISHVDHVWDEPRWSAFLERLAFRRTQVGCLLHPAGSNLDSISSIRQDD